MPGLGIGISPLLRRSGGGVGVATYITASGGNVTRDGDYLVHTFLGSDTLNITQTSNNGTYNSLQYLIVGGGGGGGADVGGGGSGGEFKSGSFIPSITNYSIIVGSGGSGSTSGNTPGGLGGNSSFNSLISIGGGGGGSLATGFPTQGAYGGGAIGYTINNTGATGIVAYKGGDNTIISPAATGGGGGGAGGNGANSIAANSGFTFGGIGLSSSISGTSVTYSAGGKGSGDSYTGIQPGASNSGNGGDAAGSPNEGKNGGSGIVIVRYYSPITFGSKTLAYSNTVYSRGGSLTANEVTYLNTFEASVGSDLDEFDRLYIHGLSNEIAAKTSFVNPTSTMITAVNSPTFTPNFGYNSNGSTSYLNLNFNLRNDAVKFQLNNCSQFTYSRTNSASTQVDSGGSDGSNKTLMDIREIDDRSYSFINVSTADGLSNYVASNSLGLFFSKRVASNLAYQYQAGVLKNTITVASTALPNVSLFALALNNSGSPLYHANRLTSIRGYGSGAINQTTLYNAVQTLGTSLGWALTQNNVSAYGGVNGNTTTATNTTNAKLIVATIHSYQPAGTPSITDSAGNTWILISRINGATAASVSAYYCLNPITSTSHTFSSSLGGGYASISINVFSGPNFTFNGFNSNTGGSVTSIAAGLITPASVRNLIITSLNYWIADAPNSISDGFAITNNIPATPTTLAGSTAYKLNSAAVNPTWSWTNASGEVAAIITCFTY